MAALNDQISVPAITMEDDLGIVYLVENAQQFWSELEDTLNFGTDDAPTLSLLDSTLRRFLALCTAYHEQYLQTPLQLEHACDLILDSELFEFHSERMSEIIVNDIKSRTDPHANLVFYHVLLCYGRRRPDFFRSHKRWQPLLPLLMDHILVEIDPDVEDTYFGMAGGSIGGLVAVPVPIEAKLRSLGVKLLYEVCRVQKLSVQDLRIFDDAFIEYLFDLVEQTRHMHDEIFNYSVIKLIISLNEQFMVASLPPEGSSLGSTLNAAEISESKNRVLRLLMRRLGTSKTFGENMIFMLNRAQHTPDDLCMQLLILKTLYVLFTTKGTSEYFYTNDLRVLVDVFLRELVDLDEDSDSLRHTYLRVLHPLLTKTQLRDIPYKRPQIVYALESLMGNSRIRDVNPTTKRLVERCLGGNWCVQLRQIHPSHEDTRHGSPVSDASTAQSPMQLGLSSVAASTHLERSASKTLKSSKSAEHLNGRVEQQRQPRSHLDSLRRTSNTSAASLSGIAHAHPHIVAPTLHTIVDANVSPPVSAPATLLQTPKRKGTTTSAHVDGPHSGRHHHHTAPLHPHTHTEAEFHHHHHQLLAPVPASMPMSAPTMPISTPATAPPSSLPSEKAMSNVRDAHRRSAPPPPPKRRKPPAVPISAQGGRTHSGATITTIRSSAQVSPLTKGLAKVPSQGLQA